jgi:uncharacterized membrane protein
MIETLSNTWFWELLGRLHPLIIHFPIGALVIAFLFEILNFKGKRPELRSGIKGLIYVGTASAVAAVIAGLMLAYNGNYNESTLSYHRWSGIAVLIISSMTSWLLLRAERSGRGLDLNLYRAALTVTMVVITVAGDYGAKLTHGDDYITSVLPWNREDELAPGEFTALVSEVQDHQKMDEVSQVHLTKINVGVRKIFISKCYKCHDTNNAEGDLRLHNEESVFKGGKHGIIIKKGDPENSELIRRVTLPEGHKELMPQKASSLTQEEIDLMALWIKLGAPWSDEKVQIFREAKLELFKPALPVSADPNLTNPIDKFTDDYYKKHNLTWAKPIEDAVFIRRVYLDAIGLLPTPNEVSMFVADKATDKRDRLVEALLNRNHDYAQHWLSFWNDLLRNDYSGPGFITKGRGQITTWLYASLLTNLPYDSMVRQLINPTEDSRGFIRGIEWRGTINSSQTTHMQAAQNISQSLLGVNLKCASCHDSFISNLTLKQAYSFAQIFSDSSLSIERCDIPTGQLAQPDFIYAALGKVDGLTVKERLSQLSKLIASKEDGRLYRTIANRFWDRLIGRGIVEPVDVMDNVPWSQEMLDWLAADLIDHNYDLKYLLSSILRSKTYQLPSTELSDLDAASQEYVFKGPITKRLAAEQFADAVSQVAAPFYYAVAFDPYKTQLAGAAWIWFNVTDSVKRRISPKPGTYYLRSEFEIPKGRTIQDAELLVTVDNEYSLYLNGNVISSGKDWREVHRLDVTNALLTGSKAGSRNVLAIKGINTGTIPNQAGALLHLRIRFTEGEPMEVTTNRDDWKTTNKTPGQGWESSGFNDSTWVAPVEFGTMGPAAPSLASLSHKIQKNKKSEVTPPNEGRRTSASAWGSMPAFRHDLHADSIKFARASLVKLDAFLIAMGRPTREVVATTRSAETTLLQSLELTNGVALNEVLGRGADRWLSQYRKNPDKMIEEIYLTAYGRTPQQKEREVAAELITTSPSKESVQDFLWAVVMQPEFQLIY